MARRRRWWLAGATALGLVTAVALVLALVVAARAPERNVGYWFAVGQTIVAFLVPVAGVIGWMTRQANRRQRPEGADPATALRAAIRAAWGPAATIPAHRPHPLATRLRTDVRAGLQTAGARRRAGAALSGGDPPRTAAETLQTLMEKSSNRQVLLVGEAGAGKTTIIRRYAGAAATDPTCTLAVPLSIAGWRPGQDPSAPPVPGTAGATSGGLVDWAAARIAEDYPVLRSADARALITNDRIVVLLDGLDEMPPEAHGRALQRLEAAAPSMRMIITCRTADYADMVAGHGILPDATVVEVAPVDAAAALEYLTEREADDSRRWEPIAATIRNNPAGPVASVLTTPLMISLAREVYRPGARNPAELCQLASAAEVGDRLLSRFLPSVYGEQAAARVAGWLSCLSATMAVPAGDPDLRWWRLAGAVPQTVIVAAIVAAMATLGTVTAAVLGIAMPFGAATGFVLGLAAGLQTARVAGQPAEPPTRWLWVRAVVVALCDLCTATGTLAAAALLSLPVLAVSAPTTADTLAMWLTDLSRPVVLASTETGAALVVAAAVAAALLAVTNGMSAGRAGAPHRSRPRWRALPGRLLAGTAVGILVSTPWWILHGLARLGAIGWITAHDALGFGMTSAFLVGVPVGLSRWLRAPVPVLDSTSPPEQMRSDRNALLLATAATIGTVCVATLAKMAAKGVPAPDAAVTVAIAGVLTGVLVFFGSGAAWLTYGIARLALAATGRLPWRLNRFLQHAHTAGVLRQAGHVYQIRHDLVREFLTGARADRPTRRAPRRWRGLRDTARSLVGVAAVAALFLTAGAMDPRTTGPPNALLAEPAFNPAFSPDGRLLATVGVDEEIHVWDSRDGSHVAALGRAGAPCRVEFGPDGTVAALDDTGTTVLWNPSRGTVRARLDGHGTSLNPVFSPDSTLVATEDEDQLVRLWDTTTGAVVATAPVPGAQPVFAPDSRTVTTTTVNGTVLLWTVSGAPVADLGPSTSPAVYSPDGATIAVAGPDQVRMHDARTGQTLRPLPGSGADALPAFGPDGLLITAAPADRKVRLWHTDSGRLVTTLDAGGDHHVRAVFTPDRSLLVTRGVDSDITVRRPADGSRISGLHPVPEDTWWQFTPDSETIIVFGTSTTRFWDLRSGALNAIGEPADQVRVSPIGATVALVDVGGAVRLWDMSED